MKISASFKDTIIEIICLLYILLFVYAAQSKLLDFENFQAQLGQSPLLSPFAGIVSYSVIIIELLIAVLIVIPVLRLAALYMALMLMIMFTAYIVIILNFSSFVPCSCGGVLEKMSWRVHLIFNCGFAFLGICAILLLSKNWRKSTLILSVAVSISALFVTVAFTLSEDIMQKENPFIRRFPQGTASKIAGVDIKFYSTYFAGSANGKIYLANHKAPLQIIEYDTNLKNKKQYTIKLDRDDFNFQSVEVRIVYPYFYLYDGNVPVIYRGQISDWRAEVISLKKFSFIDIIFEDSGNAYIRGRAPNNGENILARIEGDKLHTIHYSPMLLEKQSDGVFDTDGTLQYSSELKKVIYTYFYRNQYIVADESLILESRNHTIDTTTRAKLKIVKLKSSGDSKLAAPPYTVNRRTTVSNNLLFVNSMLRGKYESREVWRSASAVDVYDILKHTYILSFYVYDEEEDKMKDFFATDEALYIIMGHQLLKYAYGQRIKSRFDKKDTGR